MRCLSALSRRFLAGPQVVATRFRPDRGALFIVPTNYRNGCGYKGNGVPVWVTEVTQLRNHSRYSRSLSCEAVPLLDSNVQLCEQTPCRAVSPFRLALTLGLLASPCGLLRTEVVLSNGTLSDSPANLHAVGIEKYKPYLLHKHLLLTRSMNKSTHLRL